MLCQRVQIYKKVEQTSCKLSGLVFFLANESSGSSELIKSPTVVSVMQQALNTLCIFKQRYAQTTRSSCGRRRLNPLANFKCERLVLTLHQNTDKGGDIEKLQSVSKPSAEERGRTKSSNNVQSNPLYPALPPSSLWWSLRRTTLYLQ